MYHLIINGQKLEKSNAKKLAKIEKMFKDAGKEYTVHRTRYKGHAGEIAASLTQNGEQANIISVGGDGTLHEILNGIKSFENTVLGIIPLGTGNDFAKSAHVPKDTEKAVNIILGGSARAVDFIELSSGVRSLNAVGMGIDVDVLKRAYGGSNKKKSKYLHALIVSLAKFKSYEFTVKYNGKEEKHFGLIAALGNGRQIGGGIKLFPKAEIDDGYMELVIADFISKFRTIGAFIKLMRGKVHKIKQVTVVRCKAAEFCYLGEHYTIQADGELYDDMPLSARIIQNKLKIYLPEK